MKLLKIFNNIGNKNNLQGKSRNRSALQNLVKLGFPLKNIRRALIVLNEINLSSEVENESISLPTLSNTLRGKQANEAAKALLAKKLNIEANELFPNTQVNHAAKN